MSEPFFALTSITKSGGQPADAPAWELEVEAPASMQFALRDGSRSATAWCIPSQVRAEAGASARRVRWNEAGRLNFPVSGLRFRQRLSTAELAEFSAECAENT